jgi:hypothetical protein
MNADHNTPGLLETLTAAALTVSSSMEAPPVNNAPTIPQPPHKAVNPENTVLKSRHAMRSFNDETTYEVSGEELLSDQTLHQDLAWMTYDNIAEPYHQQILEGFETKYSDVMHDTTITDATYRSLPSPVRNVNLLTRLKQHAKTTSLPEHYDTVNDAVKAMGTTVMTESFFNQDATPPANATINEADVGYGQASPWTRQYLHEHKEFPPTNDSTWFDISTQAQFITAWYDETHSDNVSNAVAQAAYNTGITEAKQQTRPVTQYHTIWSERHQRYFTTPSSETQQWILDQAGLTTTSDTAGQDTTVAE